MSTPLQALEWPTLLARAAEHARTGPGRARLDRLNDPENWEPNLELSREAQAETEEAMRLLDRDGLWGPLTGLAPIDEALETLERAGLLELEQLRELRGWLFAAQAWRETPRDELRGDRFRASLDSIPPLSDPLRAMGRVLTPEGEVSENASSKLAALNSEIRATQAEIRRVLDSLLRTLASKNVLQESYSDLRDGRYVIPVRISAQNEVEGILHEASASRQTVFIEPREVTVLNNKLRSRQNDRLQEVHRVLQELCDQLRPHRAAIAQAASILSHWDAVQAKARLAECYGGQPIQVTADRVFLLEQTAHPLLYWSLPPEKIVRNRIEYGEPARTLLLTGPNTGGKTVFLKTLGLAGACARTGFPFPSSGTPVVPFFDRFFVDVGDPQSIEAHLSSFSGHILRFREILECVSDRSLVLLDELNSATDPEEGAALGRAFLETLMKRGTMIVSTTHDPSLKALAHQDERILCASMAFDEASRMPTYGIRIGVPGRSRALETAERLGLPADVLALARTYLSPDHHAFEKLLSGLEGDLATAERDRAEAARLREEAERMRAEWIARTENSVGEALEKTRARLRRIVEEAQEQVRASVRLLEEARTRRDVDVSRSAISEASQAATAALEQALREEAPSVAQALEAARKQKLEDQAKRARAPLAAGESVRVPKWKNIGKVLSVDEAAGKVKVALGALQISLSVTEIERMSPQEALATAPSRHSPRGKGWSFDAATQAPPPSLDLRGKRRDDALQELERYLDLAFRSEAYVEVTIVTGLGTGAIREGARKLLGSLPYVREFRDGGEGRGGTGALVVTFDR